MTESRAANRDTTEDGVSLARQVIVIPTYNEAENLRSLLNRLLTVFSADLMIVDDNSPDGTGAIADEFAADSQRVDVLHREGKGGLASAYVDGFTRALDAGYDVIFQMDADGSHDETALPPMLEALKDHDLAVGSRYVPGGGTVNWPWTRRAISRGGSMYVRALLGIPAQDTTSGFKGWRAPLLREVLAGGVDANGYVFQIEMTTRAVRAGGRLTEVPIQFVDRQLGDSKFSVGILAEAMAQVTKMGVRRLLRLG